MSETLPRCGLSKNYYYRAVIFPRWRRCRQLAVAVLLTAIFVTTIPAPPAHAHAELLQTSPGNEDVVGGTVDTILLQFFDLDLDRPQNARVFDAAGTEITSLFALDDQRIVLTLPDPITTPGTYLVRYAVVGLDGDFTEESFSFTWQQGAPEARGITVELGAPPGFNFVNFALLLVIAAIAAFLVHRVVMASKEHRAAQAQAAQAQAAAAAAEAEAEADGEEAGPEE